jgi:hypothetical protein
VGRGAMVCRAADADEITSLRVITTERTASPFFPSGGKVMPFRENVSAPAFPSATLNSLIALQRCSCPGSITICCVRIESIVIVSHDVSEARAVRIIESSALLAWPTVIDVERSLTVPSPSSLSERCRIKYKAPATTTIMARINKPRLPCRKLGRVNVGLGIDAMNVVTCSFADIRGAAGRASGCGMREGLRKLCGTKERSSSSTAKTRSIKPLISADGSRNAWA